jgi:Pyruvate/2-oxoacid:ferredoxin oxidoreductase delta subunit
MDKEMLDQVNKILQREIDPIYFNVTKKIAPNYPNSRYIPWLLAHKLTPQEAGVLDALPDENWTPEIGELRVSQAFADKLGMEKPDVDDIILKCYYGAEVIHDPEKGPILRVDTVQWMDLQHHPVWRDKNGPAYYQVLERMLDDEFSPHLDDEIDERKKKGLYGLFRIIPRYDSVKDCPDLLPAENYKIILQTREVLTLMECPCRFRHPEAQENIGVCVTGNTSAKGLIRMGMTRQYSWKEVFDTVQKAGKKEPFIQTTRAGDKLEDIKDVLCNCNVRSCGMFKNHFTYGTRHKPWDYALKSRFRAELDIEKCINCGLCKNKRCMFNAIQEKYYRETGKQGLYVNETQCMGCGCCVETCPTGALKMKLVDPPEALLGYRLDMIPKEMPEEEKKGDE